mmetsp:Transcript_7464/g.9926  ORF Transcript_7464/g.9926 Transcript_7464/m.9926 type:complete len:86 (-) Transcript_7464:598-855(-)
MFPQQIVNVVSPPFQRSDSSICIFNASLREGITVGTCTHKNPNGHYIHKKSSRKICTVPVCEEANRDNLLVIKPFHDIYHAHKPN